VRHRFTLSLVACVNIVGALAFLGCNPAGDRASFDRSISSPLAPSAFDVGTTGVATSVSWACFTNGADRNELVASGWTIHRDPCPSMVAPRLTTAAFGAPVFSPEPTNLRASIMGANTVQVDWDQPPSASAWQLEAGSAPGLSNLAIFRTSTRSLTVTSVPDGTYHLRVRSAPADFSDLSVPSNEISLSISGCRAQEFVPAPTGFTAHIVGNAVTLSWNPPVVGVASYVLGVGSAPGLADLVIFDTRSTATSLRATAPNGVYYARIHTRTPCGDSGPSSEITIVVPQQATQLPPPPVADFSFERGSLGGLCPYRGCLFDATRSTGTGLNYLWDFADGSTGTGLFVVHVYARPAALREMTVVLTVSDAFGRTSTKARALFISPNY
jgi:PKD repeat protein